jgi:hypothetical protein
MDQLQALNLPPYPFKISDKDGQLTLFDETRQHFVQYLINQKKYPKTLIKLEGGLRLNGMAKRSDIVVFNASGEKILMVECKAPSVSINQKVFDQIARYNMTHQIALLAVTNGLEHYYCRIDFENGTYQFIGDLPDYGG